MIPMERCGLSAACQKGLADTFARHPLIESAVLYRSRAKGNFKLGSDIDLTLKAPKLSLQELFEIENEIDDLLLPYKVDLSLLHCIEHDALIDHINRVGLRFYVASSLAIRP